MNLKNCFLFINVTRVNILLKLDFFFVDKILSFKYTSRKRLV